MALFIHLVRPNACIIFSRSVSCSYFRRSSVHRYFSSKQKPDPSSYLFRPTDINIVDNLGEKLQSKDIKYRHRPGILKMPVQSVDEETASAIGQLLKDAEPVSQHKVRAEKMERHLRNRRLPPEPYDIENLRRDIERRLRESEAKKGITPDTFDTDEQRAVFEEYVQQKVERRTMRSIYHWKPEKYDSFSTCLTYCILRFAPEYAVLRRIFNEIVKKELNFKPKYVFDFGSGVGTTFFASESTWPSTVEEYFCVDVSEEMNKLFHLLLHGGIEKNGPRHPNVATRPFLPATSDRQYDVVVSAYSLFELPSYEDRMRTVVNLWMKTKEFLILIERGTNAGFRAIREARDYVLANGHEIHRNILSEIAQEKQVDTLDVELILQDKEKTPSEKFRILREKYPNVEFPTMLPHGHVFAPCPHDMGCPRLMDITPCNFAVRYFPLRLSGGQHEPETELFSFIILRKGYAPMPTERWPRIVREPRKSKSCVWCQTCSPRGVLEDMPFHKGRSTSERGTRFRLAKYSSWGDLLPISTSYDEDIEEGEKENDGDISSEDE